MRRFIALLGGFASLSFFALAWAGSPHFVGDCVLVSQVDNCVTVSGKEAGLGDEEQINVVLTAEAQCVNPGGNAPKAANKEDVVGAFDIPVQNGKANYTVTACAEFQPSCSPPMSVVFSNILITDATNGLECMP